MKNNQGSGIRDQGPGGEQGFMLLGLIVAVALILLALSIAAPEMARSLRRERDVEAVHRGNEYVRAIQLYYKKFGHYPGSMEQLEKTNNIRFLRQRYKDPVNGKDDWRTIAVGQNKTTVKAFFGQPLTGLVTSPLGGALAGQASTGMGQALAPNGGPAIGGGFVPASGAAGTTAGAAGSPGAVGAAGTPGAAGADTTGTTGFGAPGLSGTGGSAPFMGVGLSATGDSIVELNEQTSYATWEFLYDPRIEALKTKGALNSGAGSVPAGALGSPVSPTGQTPTFGTGTTGTPTTPAPPVVGAPVQP